MKFHKQTTNNVGIYFISAEDLMKKDITQIFFTLPIGTKILGSLHDVKEDRTAIKIEHPSLDICSPNKGTPIYSINSNKWVRIG